MQMAYQPTDNIDMREYKKKKYMCEMKFVGDKGGKSDSVPDTGNIGTMQNLLQLLWSSVLRYRTSDAPGPISGSQTAIRSVLYSVINLVGDWRQLLNTRNNERADGRRPKIVRGFYEDNGTSDVGVDTTCYIILFSTREIRSYLVR